MSEAAMLAVLYAPPPQGAKNVSAHDVYRVELVVASYANGHGDGACPSQRKIADALGLDLRTVWNAIVALRKQGRLVKTADGVPRVRGATYIVTVAVDSTGDSTG